MDEQLDDPQATDVVIVGGGLAGLVAAATAAGTDGRTSVTLIEPRPLGGRARCDERDGYLFNRGPRALYIGGAADRILSGLGVDTRSGGKPAMSSPGAIHDGALHRFPGSAGGALRTTLLTKREKLAMGKAMGSAFGGGPRSRPDLSVAGWLDEHQVTGTVRQLLEALVRVSTYVNAPDEMPAAPALANARRASTSGVRYLDGGFQSLVDGLEAIAVQRGVGFASGSVRGIESNPGGSLRVLLADGTHARASAVVIAAGGPDAAAAVLGATPASWGRLGTPATAACLELGVRKAPPHTFVLGIDEPTYLSVHAPPARLAPEGHAVVHVMRYQEAGEELSADEQHATLRRLAADAGIVRDDIETERYLVRMVVSGAIPTMAAGGMGGRPSVAVAEHPGVFLAGDWVGPEGLLIDACAASGTQAGRLAAARSTTMVGA